MKWLKKLFRKKQKETQEEIVEEPRDVQVQEVPKTKERECEICHEEILQDERYTKQQGHYYHKKCWKLAEKMANM